MEDIYDDFYDDIRVKAEVEARDYLFNKKKRAPKIRFEGEIDGEPITFLCSFSQEEITQIAQLLVNAYNETYASEMSVNTIDDLTKRIFLYELENYNNKELKRFFKYFKDIEMKLQSFNLQPHFDYEMSCYFWDITKRKITKKYPFSVDLTDEEYIYLLTEQLVFNTRYTFNDLVFERPSLARKIANTAKTSYKDGFEDYGCPYLIILDEVIKDAYAIDGPTSASEELYYDERNNSQYHVCAHTYRHILTICEDDLSDTIPAKELRNLELIDADKVQEILGANNYEQMMEIMKNRFCTPSSFDDIKSWLDKEHVNYTETKGATPMNQGTDILQTIMSSQINDCSLLMLIRVAPEYLRSPQRSHYDPSHL